MKQLLLSIGIALVACNAPTTNKQIIQYVNLDSIRMEQAKREVIRAWQWQYDSIVKVKDSLVQLHDEYHFQTQLNIITATGRIYAVDGDRWIKKAEYTQSLMNKTEQLALQQYPKMDQLNKMIINARAK